MIDLENPQHLMQASFEATPDPIWLKDHSGVYLACNHRFEDLIGAKQEDVVGKTDYDFFEKPVADAFREHDLNAMSANETLTNEEWVTFAIDQKQYLLETIKKPLTTTNGDVIGILGVSRDITEHRRREDALKQSDLRLNATLRATKIGVWEWDITNDIWWATPSYFTMHGYDPVEDQGNRSKELAKVHPDDREMVLGKINQILNSTRSSYEYEARIRHINGEYRWVNVRATITQFEDNKPSRMLGVRIDVDELKKAQQHVEWLAKHDPLTGLANRTGLSNFFQKAVTQASKTNGQMALLFLDLDRFKNINDNLGHRVGDMLLMEVANRMRTHIDPTALVARQGGDEFVVLYPQVKESEVRQSVKALQEQLCQKYELGTHELVVTPSIGVSLYPRDGTDLDTLYKRADVAMYFAKGQGPNRYSFFTQEMQSRVGRQLAIESQLRNAISNNELYLVYQPQVSLVDGALIGAEVLIRWNNEQLGEVSPGEFISVAEDSGQIVAIGEWVLDTAMKQFREWCDTDIAPNLLAINISAIQFRHSNLATMITSVLERHKIPPHRVELELTESVAMDNPDHVIETMQQFQQLGMSIALDDFGTGYSSLSYLKRLPLKKLKIDQSFTRNMINDQNDRAIVKGIIALASSLGYTTIAEGVEELTQQDLLKKLGCDEAQGYYYSRPLPASEFSSILMGDDCKAK